jgi:hypothetical protein
LTYQWFPARQQDETLDPAQVRHLITALDEKCRTLAF